MFKEVPNYPGYMVNENSIIINKKGHALQPALDNMGRPRVGLETYDENGKFICRDNRYIYRISAEVFLPNPQNYPVVMHIDNDVLHNHISNLKWGTQSENIRQAFDEGRKVSPNKDKHERYVYEVSNKDGSDIIKCKGCKGVSELLNIAEKTVRPGLITSGRYKNYTIRNTGIKAIQPIYFKEN